MSIPRYFYYIVIGSGVSLVFFFSWLPNPNIGFQPYFPRWLGDWINNNGNLRTAVPFVFLGFVGECFVSNKSGSIWKKRVGILVACTLIVSLAEIGQMFLPKRNFDPEDIAWGVAGTVMGLATGVWGKRCWLYGN